MTNNSIGNLYSDFRSTFENSPDFIIDFYNKNSIALNNISGFSDKEELRLYIEIITKYIEAIYHKNHYNEAIDIANKQQAFIDNEILKLNAHDIKDAWYHDIAFVKAMASSRLKDYKTATPIFRELMHFDPKNDLFRDWYNHSLYGQRIWLVNLINIVCGILIVSEIFFKEYLPNIINGFPLIGLGLFGLLANWGFEYYVKYSFKRTTKTD
ncbi:MAG: hypothetical protein WCO54_05165 [Bacteroidota bacterium]